MVGGSSPSERASQVRRFRPRSSGPLANGFANSGRITGLDRAGEDVRRRGDLLPDHVRVDPQRHRRVSMSQASRDHMHRHPGQQQGCGMDMPQIMQPRMRKQLTGADRARGHVTCPDQVPDQRRHRVRVNRAAPSGGEHVLITTDPLRASGKPFFRLPGAMLLHHLDCSGIDADRPRPAALSRPLDAGAADHRSRAADADLAAAGTGVSGQMEESEQAMTPGRIKAAPRARRQRRRSASEGPRGGAGPHSRRHRDPGLISESVDTVLRSCRSSDRTARL